MKKFSKIAAVALTGAMLVGASVGLTACNNGGNNDGDKGGKLVYLAGKYTSSIGPIFAAVLNATQGNPIRDNGNALNISQGYGVATNYTEFQSQAADSTTSPVFSKAVLDKFIGANISYADFKAAVENDAKGVTVSAESTATYPTEKLHIGVLVSDVEGDEAKGFRSYYKSYIETKYNVEFHYTDALADATAESAALDDFIAQGYKAVISLSAGDRAAQISKCTQNNVYYAVASGVLDDAVFEQYKANQYFVGQIGPSNDAEYQAGKAMGTHFKNKGVKKVAIYGAFIPNPMHVYRLVGMLEGLGVTYDGATGMAAVGAMFASGGNLDISKFAGDVTVQTYMGGYNPATMATEFEAMAAKNPDAFLSVGMATTFFAESLQDAGIDYSDIDAFTTNNGNQMK